MQKNVNIPKSKTDQYIQMENRVEINVNLWNKNKHYLFEISEKILPSLYWKLLIKNCEQSEQKQKLKYEKNTVEKTNSIKYVKIDHKLITDALNLYMWIIWDQQFVQHLIRLTHPSISFINVCTHIKHTQKINLWPLNSFKLISNEKIRFQWSVYCWQFFLKSRVHCKLTTSKIKCFDFIGYFIFSSHRNYRHVFLCDIKNYSVKKNSK